MQLNKIINFHKTMGDKTRIQIIALLKNGPLHGQALAGKLGLTPPTISYHVTKLREIDLIYQRRDKNTIYFHLNEKKLTFMAEAILRIGDEKEMGPFQVEGEEKQRIIGNFLQQDGRLKTLPAQRKKKLIVLEHLVKGLEKGKIYDEKEINEYIKPLYDDYATIRREFIICQFMTRENGKYELNPKELWLI